MNSGSFQGFARGAGIGGARHKTYVLTKSNSGFPIPEWARNGNGIVYVTGCGGGGSGAISTTSGQRGFGGAAGGFCIDLPVYIPYAVTSAEVVIGAGGAAVTANTATSGVSGGTTTLTIGDIRVNLEGGRGGSASGSPRGLSYIGDAVPASHDVNTGANNSFGVNNSTAVINGGILMSPPSPFGGGAPGGVGSTSAGAWGAGGKSVFGAGGAGLSAAPSATTPGGDAIGYGAGGAGALSLSGDTVSSGAGSPGILILKFVECFK